MSSEDGLFAKLEAGEEIEEVDAEGTLLALMYFVPRREEDHWRTAIFESRYLHEKKQYFDSRKQDYPEFWQPWERYIEAARAAKADILAGRIPPPSPGPAETAAPPAPVAEEPPVAEREEPPMLVADYQRELRRQMEQERRPRPAADSVPPPRPGMSAMQYLARLRTQKRGTDAFWLAHAEWQAAKNAERERETR
jgi:hypothetical protein